MLYIIEPYLKVKAQALPFVERYGGIAYPMTHTFNTETIKTFPVSMSLTGAQCFDQGKYSNLVPDERYKSVSYFEGLTSPSQVTFDDPKKGIAIIRQAVKFVVWLNMKKLGFEDYSQVGLMALAALAEFQDTYAVNYGGNMGRMKVTGAAIRMDKNGVFGGYTYQDKQHLFMWPFAFFAIEMTTVTELPRRCLAEIEVMEPIECITLW